MKLKKKRALKKEANPSKFSKFGLIYQTCNSWNLRPVLNQEAQFPTNKMSKHEIKKNQF